MATPAEISEFRVDVPDLGGGMNRGVAAGMLPDNQSRLLQNWYPFAKGLRRRRGTKRLTGTASPGQIRGAYRWAKSAMIPADPPEDGLRRRRLSGVVSAPSQVVPIAPVILGGRIGFAMIPEGATEIVPVTGTDPAWPISDLPWVFAPYREGMYATRPDNGPLRRIGLNDTGTSGTAREAGHLAVQVGVLIDTLPGGSLDAGTYYVVCQDANDEEGWESNPSQVATVVLATSDKALQYTTTIFDPPDPTDKNGRVRRWFRSLPDIDGVYYFVGEAHRNGSAESYPPLIDNVSIANLGLPVSFANAPPPPQLRSIASHNERLWATDGFSGFFSELGLAESWGLDSGGNAISLDPNDNGGICRAIVSGPDRIFFGKSNEILYVTGDDISDFRVRTLDSEHGCAAHHTMHWAGGRLLWYDGDNIIMSNGGPGRVVGGEEVRDYLDAAVQARKVYSVAAVYEPLSMYVFSFCRENGGPANFNEDNNVVLALNYETGAWCEFVLPFTEKPGGPDPQQFDDHHGPSCLYAGVGGLYGALYDGFPLRFLDKGTGTDLASAAGVPGTAITAIALGKAHQGRSPGAKFVVKLFHVLAFRETPPDPPTTTQLHMSVQYADLDASALKQRTVELFREFPGSVIVPQSSWSTINLSTKHQAAAQLYFSFRYDGEEELILQAYAFEGEHLSRHAPVQ